MSTPVIDPAELMLMAKRASALVLAGKYAPSAAVASQLKTEKVTREHAQRVVEMTNRELLGDHLTSAKTAADRKTGFPVARLESVLQLTGALPDPNVRTAVVKAAAAVAGSKFRLENSAENPLEVIFGAEVVKAAASEEAKQGRNKMASLELMEQLRSAHSELTSRLNQISGQVKEAAETLDVRVREVKARGVAPEEIVSATAMVSENPTFHGEWIKVSFDLQHEKLAAAVGAYRNVAPALDHPLIQAYARFEKVSMLERRVGGGREVLRQKLSRKAG